ncbi:transmembrane protein 87A [Cocos nucifera]|uniref:Transmembrane protein 87A n=1 Tax=Cocos nucifera TaxID=13894 RepID=A0A8K0I2J4_COCNU|nr:transmembrane protein 87A [Cocos nucifera]
MARFDPLISSSSPLLLLIHGVLLLLFAYSGDASVHDYTGEKFVAKGNAFVLHGGSEGLYASLPSPNASAAGNGVSFIRFEKITFRRSEKAVAASKDTDLVRVQAIVFEIDDRGSIGGSAYGGQRAICCTPDLAKLGVCTQGKTVWKNPTGYLPERMAPLMNFYGFMSLAFVILGIFWFSQYARFWREILPLQNCITFVIALGMFEMALWYFEYAEFNKAGVRPKGMTFWAVTSGTVKRTVSRVIILVVSMGFGVVRPTLGGLTSKVLMLGATFLVASEVLELVENVGAVSDLSGKARLFMVLPVAVLDAFFIIWIFTSLSKTLDKLQARRLMAKLDIYRKFTNALAVAVIVSVGWIGYEMFILPFELLFLVACSAMMRYAYSDDASEDFDREDTLSLIKPGPMPSKDGRGSSASPDARALNINTTTLHNRDIEEDKRE